MHSLVTKNISKQNISKGFMESPSKLLKYVYMSSMIINWLITSMILRH